MLSYPAQLGFPHSMQKFQVLHNGNFKDLSSLQTFAWALHETDDFVNQLHKSNVHVEGNETGSDVASDELHADIWTPGKCSQNANKPSLITVGRSFSSSFVSNEQGHVPVL